MSSSAELHLSYKVGNAPLSMFPYPHFYVQDVFPPDYYRRLQQCLPDATDMLPIEQARPVKGYKERFVMDIGGEHLATLSPEKQLFWKEMQGWLVGRRFGHLLFNKFAPFIQERFKGQPQPEFYDESLLVHDIANYKLGPHTDATRKVITLLFYLPKDDSQRDLGTSIYVPKDPAFTCMGGPHHQHANFDLLYTMPFLPNSVFCFLKTYNSFHGVEPVLDPQAKRWLLLYDIYAREAPAVVKPLEIPVSSMKFSF